MGTRMMPSRLALIALGCAALAAAAPAFSQVARQGSSSGGDSQMAQQYQRVSAERNALQAENARLKQDAAEAKAKLAEVGKQSDTLKTGSANAKVALAAAQASLKASELALDQARAKLQELIVRYRDTTATLAGVETERTQLKQDLAQSLARYDVCVERNMGLFDVSTEVLDRFEHQNFFSAMSRSEPFTRITSARLDTMVDDYRARAAELRVFRSKANAPSAPAPTHP